LCLHLMVKDKCMSNNIDAHRMIPTL
jgi:hypothetical protein